MSLQTPNTMDQFDDDYVASLLKNEAKSSSNNYLVRGLQGFLPSRSTGAAAKPKPNTRFLRNIVRDVDSHNAALLAKENAEAQARLRRLQRQKEGRLSRSPSPPPRDRIKRRRSPHDSRSESPEDRRRRRHHRRSKRSRSRSPGRHNSTRSEYDSNSRRKKSRHSRSRSPERKEKRSHRRREDRDKRHRSRSRSKDRRDSRDSRRHGDRADRSKRRRSRSRVRDADTSETEKTSGRRNPGEMDNNQKSRDATPDSHDSTFSDPLEELIGPSPQPQPRARGRGAIGQAAMDSRFLADYDPAMEAEPDSVDEAADFEEALEAYRDRQKWKQQGAERLRSAGLGEDFIKAWENNDIKNEANLKWAKKGGMREWDRGKVLEDDDSGSAVIDLRADWIKK